MREDVAETVLLLQSAMLLYDSLSVCPSVLRSCFAGTAKHITVTKLLAIVILSVFSSVCMTH